jgi:D-sedoheptulose 7-phosphate isomerase
LVELMDLDEYTPWLEAQVDGSVEVHESVHEQLPVVLDVAGAMIATFRDGGRVFFFGNGGSAADAQHWAAELSGRFYRDRAPLPAVALTTNSSAVTAIANDDGYGEIFVRQLAGQAEAGDVAVGISTSGNSANVVRALRYGQEHGLVTVGVTSTGDGEMDSFCTHRIDIPSDDVARIQEGHLLCGHLLCALVERELFGDEANRS